VTSAALSRLEKRIDSLEAGTSAFEDPTLVMLDALTDNELGVLEEYNSLQKCGYSESEIEKMMPDYSMVFDIAAKMKAMMSNLTDGELQILERYNSLCRRGHSESQIELMMGKAGYASLSDIAAKMKAPKAEESSQGEKPAKRKIKAQSVFIDHIDLYASDNEEPANE
jgi:hypothetical protein